MKTVFTAIILTLAAAGASADVPAWSDLEMGPKYELTMGMPVNAEIGFAKGHPFVLEDVYYGGGVPVIFFTLRDLICEHPEAGTELELFNPEPENTAEDKSIGVRLYPGCRLEIMVESKYYYDTGVFRMALPAR